MNRLPSKSEVDRMLASFEREHPRQIAKTKVAVYRASKHSYLTQQDIDGDGRGEGRMGLVMSQTVRFSKRSWLAKLFGWLR